VIDESQADEVSVTVIGTGFQHHGRGRVDRAGAGEGDRGSRRPRSDRPNRAPLDIRDEDVDVPPFLR
jgi:cell division protein FtsZ